MRGSGSSVVGPYRRAAPADPESRREGLLARLPAVRLSICVTFVTLTLGYSNSIRGNSELIGTISAYSATASASDAPDCIGPTVTLNPPQGALATSSVGRESVESPKPADQPEPLAIVVRVRDTASVPDDVLTTAQAEVTRIYREAGVEILWLTTESLLAESNAFRQAALTVAILTLNQAKQIGAGVEDGRVGFAAREESGGGQFVYVIYDRVERLTGGNGVRRASMLAIAVAHEIGHLLLPSKGHSHIGLMRAEWTRADLQLAQRELASFTARQGALLRTRISASRYRITGESMQKYLCDARVR